VLESRKEGDTLVITVKVPKLDMRVAADFKEALSRAVRAKDGVALLDLGAVDFMDSSGLAAFVYCFNLTDIKNELAICSAKPRVRELLRITKMDDLLRVYDSREAALAALNNSASA